MRKHPKLVGMVFAFLCLMAIAATTPLWQPKMQSDMDAGGFAITNLASVSGPVTNQFGSGSNTNVWFTYGNNADSTNFLGTTNGAALVFKQNNLQIFNARVHWTNQAQSVTVGASNTNEISSGGFIAGSSNAIIGWNPFSVIAGGRSNIISAAESNAFFGHTLQGYNTISGGRSNLIASLSGFFAGTCSIGGGRQNSIYDSAEDQGVIAGGLNNSISNAANSFIGGGLNNSVRNGGNWSVISGGSGNVITNGTTNTFITGATIPGGVNNLASGHYSFAAGQQAAATNVGTFVWADSVNSQFASTSSNQFLIRASGGVGINTNNPGTNALKVVGNIEADSFTINGAFIGGGSTVTNSSIQSVHRYTSVTLSGVGNTYIMQLSFLLGQTLRLHCTGNGAGLDISTDLANGWLSSNTNQIETHEFILTAQSASTNVPLTFAASWYFVSQTGVPASAPTVLVPDQFYRFTLSKMGGGSKVVVSYTTATNSALISF